MADHNQLPDEDEHQTQGRKENAAQPLDAARDNAGAERYPPVRQDDAVEPRSFGGNPGPRQGAGDDQPAPTTKDEGRLGPAGDPAEGKR